MDRGLLNDATSGDDSPTPGYMLSEIARGTLANYSACLQLEEYLCSKLAKNNHNTKYKCLLVIKHVCRTGRADFKKDMCAHVEVIKACLQYKGPPDPLRGDEIYKRVRDLAKDVLDALFDSSAPVTTSSVATSNRIQGIGSNYSPSTLEPEVQQKKGSYFKSVTSAISSALGKTSDDPYAGPTAQYSNYDANATGHSTHMSTYSRNNPNNGSSNSYASQTASTASSSGMHGIGNPNFKDAREDDGSFSNYLARASNFVASATSGSSASSGPTLGDISYNSGAGSVGASTGAPGYNFATNRGQYIPSGSTVPAAWQDDKKTENSVVINPSPVTSTSTGIGKAGGAAADGEYESNLVSALVQPSGMKVTVPEDSPAVVNFLQCASTLSPDVIGNCLAFYLDTTDPSIPWQSRVKTLLVISHLVKCPRCAAHRTWWLDPHHSGLIAACLVAADSPSIKPLVRTQASKTLTGMGIDTSAYGAATAVGHEKKRGSAAYANIKRGTTPPPAPVSIGVNLLDMDVPVAGAAPTPPASTITEGDVNLMLDPVPSVVQSAPAPVDLFGGMSLDSTEPMDATTSTILPAPMVPLSTASPGSNFNVFDILDQPLVTAPNEPSTATVGVSGFSFVRGGNMTSDASSSGGTNDIVNQNNGYMNQNNGMINQNNGFMNQNNGMMSHNNATMGQNLNGGNPTSIPVNSMTSITSQRKSIPIDEGTRVFKDAKPVVRNNVDSFSFVKDAMKSGK